jgi:hypothetical protein
MLTSTMKISMSLKPVSDDDALEGIPIGRKTDSHDEDKFIQDDQGVRLPDLAAARDQALRSLAELASNVLHRSVKCRLAVEVRDAVQPLLKTVMNFRAVLLVV